LNSYKASWG